MTLLVFLREDRAWHIKQREQKQNRPIRKVIPNQPAVCCFPIRQHQACSLLIS
ncbi:Unknown protein sequence [Pseudomonas syringae pv. maculicola]|nr:Unknown protein sequence [Pseudomonas syringae pv. maculicola]